MVMLMFPRFVFDASSHIGGGFFPASLTAQEIDTLSEQFDAPRVAQQTWRKRFPEDLFSLSGSVLITKESHEPFDLGNRPRIFNAGTRARLFHRLSTHGLQFRHFAFLFQNR